MNARIAVDFDGTIFASNADGHLVPVDHVASTLRQLREDGAYIIIYSCRTTVGQRNGNLEEEIREMRRLLQHYEIPYDEIYAQPKPIADLYVDDRAIRFEGDWRKTFDGIKNVLGD